MSAGRLDVLAIMEVAAMGCEDESRYGEAADIRAALALMAELIDAVEYALRTRDEAGALSDTAEHNLRAALAEVQP